jgi:hypothetical protein
LRKEIDAPSPRDVNLRPANPILEPHIGPEKFIKRWLDVDWHRARYKAITKSLRSKGFNQLQQTLWNVARMIR